MTTTTDTLMDPRTAAHLNRSSSSVLPVARPAARLIRPHPAPQAGPAPQSSPDDARDLGPLLDGLAGIDLESLDRQAALQTRTDRKYLVEPGRLGTVLALTTGAGDNAPPVRILEIGGERTFGYRSTYFDTPALISYQRAARSRPTRFKVRTRSYLSTGTCWLEVKVRSARGETVKNRIELPPGSDRHLTPAARQFLAGHDQIAPHLDSLAPMLVTTYQRSTLSCGAPDSPQRVTVDADLHCALADGSDVALGDLSRLLIVETKSSGHGPGPFDRALWELGIRPTVISKYAVGMAAAHRALPANKWHRLLQRHVFGHERCAPLSPKRPDPR